MQGNSHYSFRMKISSNYSAPVFHDLLWQKGVMKVYKICLLSDQQRAKQDLSLSLLSLLLPCESLGKSIGGTDCRVQAEQPIMQLPGCYCADVEPVTSHMKGHGGWSVWQQPRVVPIAPWAAGGTSGLAERAPAWLSPPRAASHVCKGFSSCLEMRMCCYWETQVWAKCVGSKCFCHWSHDQPWAGGLRYLPSCHSDTHPNALFKFRAEISDSAENGYNFQFDLPMFKATPQSCIFPEERSSRLVSARLDN